MAQTNYQCLAYFNCSFHLTLTIKTRTCVMALLVVMYPHYSISRPQMRRCVGKVLISSIQVMARLLLAYWCATMDLPAKANHFGHPQPLNVNIEAPLSTYGKPIKECGHNRIDLVCNGLDNQGKLQEKGESSTYLNWLSTITNQLMDKSWDLWMIACLHACKIATSSNSPFALGSIMY